MPIFKEHNTIFIHIPRSGGTSIEKKLGIDSIKKLKKTDQHNLFYGYDEEENELDHASSIFIIRKIGKESFENHFSFAFTRNPFTRLISQYNYCKQQPHNSFFVGLPNNFKDFIYAIKRYHPFFSQMPHSMVSHYLPQHSFVYCNKIKQVNFIGKLETIDNDTQEIFNRVGLKNTLLDRHENKTTSNINIKDYFSYSGKTSRTISNTFGLKTTGTKIIDIILDIYEKDFTTFNYNTDPFRHLNQ